MLKLNDAQRLPTQPAPVLNRIAAVLDCTVEELADPTSTDLDHTVELLRL